jgi:uncharacterized protein (TIGR03437 family)
VQGNYIGTDVTGSVALLNQVGITLSSAANTVIGGTAAGAGNVILGNQQYDLRLDGDASGVRVQGNLIGLNAAGTAILTNAGSGIVASEMPDMTIGGTTPAARNVIAGHRSYGIAVSALGRTGIQIQGNYIGTDITGAKALGNLEGGINFGGARNGLIGGTVSGARNLIVGNSSGSFVSGNGILLFGLLEGAQVLGNFIGTDLSGTAPLGANASGILVDSTRDMRIGGIEPGAGNVIAFNHRKGIEVRLALGVALRGNSIFSNELLGIDLGGFASDGVTLNDPGDADTGPNQLQNYPLLTSVNSSGNTTVIKGAFNSAANATFSLDFYANDTRDPDGLSEGQSYLGSGNVTTDAQGNANFTITLPVAVAASRYITTTATDAAGNTSEFSPSLAVNTNGLALSKVSPTYSAGVNTNTTYALNVVNTSAGDIANVTVTDNLPPQMEFVSCAATKGGVCGGTGGNRTVTFATLPANSTATISLTVKIACVARGLAQLSNTATVSAPGITPTANQTATVTQPVAGRTSFDPPSHDLIADEIGIATFRVMTTFGCPITATSNAPWITIVAAQSNGTVAYRVSANPDATPRVGTITAADAPFTVRQVGRTTSVSAASFSSDPVAGESIVALFGAGLANTTASATSLPLPTVLGGTQIRLIDRNGAGTTRTAPLFFVSAGQINYLMPAGVESGPALLFIETSENRLLASGRVNIAAVSPGLFAANANGQGVAAAVALRVKADGTQSFEPVARFDSAQSRFVSVPLDLGPADEQVFLLLFGTGFRLRTALRAVNVKIGGTDSEVLYARAQGSLAGLDQINVRLPRSLLGRGEVDINLTVDGKAANVVKVNVK